ncbi:YbjN domain-containing protein [Corynebacterium sp. HMSC29G08]|uniref:YbjN domain-containing protein n=1 Tax=Corynebacterium sp. HMSC29G08 TaxID=1581069 RepID=UPI0008A5110D|nr:YbjN domain-containing protein [Corynebacterium sp. HMSC29G08]
MGRHRRVESGRNHEPLEEVTLTRVAAALHGLGFDTLTRPDRVVVGLPTATLTVWISYQRPQTLVLDAVDRIPTAFEAATDLAQLCNQWNRDQLGPVASCRLLDAGDFRVRLRSAIPIRYGLSDAQLLTFLANFCEQQQGFATQLRAHTLPIGFDTPLPPALMRSQDHQALLKELLLDDAAFHAPDLYTPPPALSMPKPVDLEALKTSLEALEFSYAVTDGVIATGVNGVTFALMVDTGAYIRVASMWDTGLHERSAFLRTWLACNDVTDHALGTGVYLHKDLATLHVQAEASLPIVNGLSDQQRDNFVITAILSCLAAMDRVSVIVSGATYVQWPPSTP